MSLCRGCVVCLSCYSTLIKILVLFSLVYINSLSVSEHICHRFWRLTISKREKIPLFIIVSLMWFPCATHKGEISRWCKTSVVINRWHYQFYIFFLTAALVTAFVTFLLISWTFLITCLFLSFLFVNGNIAILVLTNPKSTKEKQPTKPQSQCRWQRKKQHYVLIK